MKRDATIILSTLLAAALLAGAAAAKSPFAREASRGGDQAEKAHRYNHFPTMEFITGTLNRDSWTGWELDDLKLKPVRDCHVEVDGSLLPGTLESGRQALVMGCRQGEVFVAYRVRILRPLYLDASAGLGDVELEPSESDPTVGICRGPN